LLQTGRIFKERDLPCYQRVAPIRIDLDPVSDSKMTQGAKKRAPPFPISREGWGG
jgi:hypothetical protein